MEGQQLEAIVRDLRQLAREWSRHNDQREQQETAGLQREMDQLKEQEERVIDSVIGSFLHLQQQATELQQKAAAAQERAVESRRFHGHLTRAVKELEVVVQYVREQEHGPERQTVTRQTSIQQSGLRIGDHNAMETPDTTSTELPTGGPGPSIASPSVVQPGPALKRSVPSSASSPDRSIEWRQANVPQAAGPPAKRQAGGRPSRYPVQDDLVDAALLQIQVSLGRDLQLGIDEVCEDVRAAVKRGLEALSMRGHCTPPTKANAAFVCVARALAKQRTEWVDGDNYACKDCIAKRLVCFRHDQTQQGQLLALPLPPAYREAESEDSAHMFVLS